ncbi:MAG TPA: prepilin-type N-terminal cleavage/methylation domain-containing protein [Burkholderiaceae bacterium]|nr:prepilin-type N-terminal cleavage/methylation domain-containing protein [Burkholderiaceae bacterium]
MNTCRIPSNRRDRGRRRLAGFALVEVLVAVLLFAIGILGLVGLQAAMTQTQTESKVRADAANLVDELAAVMWGELGNQATIANLAAFSTGGCAGSAACNAWLTKLGKTLPGGTLSALAFNNVADPWDANYGMVTVTLQWSLPNGGTHQYVSTFNVAQNVPSP